MKATIHSMTNKSAALRTGARLAFAFGLLWFILSRIELSQLTIKWGAGTIAGIGIATGLLIVAQLYSALRWKVILGASSPTWMYLFRLYLVGNFFSLFLPSSIGGDAVRTIAAARSTARTGEVVSSVLLDRLFGVAALLAYLALGTLVAPGLLGEIGINTRIDLPSWLPWVVAAGLLSAIALFLALRSRLRKIHHHLAQAWDLMARCARSPRLFTQAFALALLVQGLYIAIWALLATSLGFDLPFALFLLAVPLVSLAAMLPITVSGLGVRESVWLLFLTPFGIASADAVVFSLLYFLSFTLVGASGGVAFMTWGTELHPLKTAGQ